MNWNDFKCGRGEANERGDGAKFNGECGDCRANVEKYIRELESLLRGFSANFDLDNGNWCKPGATNLWVAEEADVRHWQKLVAQALTLPSREDSSRT